MLRFQPLKQWPNNSIAAAKQSPVLHSVVFHRRAVVNTLQSNEADSSKTPAPPRNKESAEQQRDKQLSGADILMALQRASVQKSKLKKDKRRSISGDSNNSREKTKKKIETPGFSHVKPLIIKDEWNDRLEEIERRLQELSDN